MADRRAPETGYDFGNKRQYRRAIYAAARRCFRNQMSDRTCAILPSIEGDEIEAAIRAGFHQSHIAIIDRNPAIVATLKRRYPLVTSIGVDADRAARRVVEAIGPIDLVNLDLCGPIGRTTYDTIDAWMSAGAIKSRGLLAITVLRGRETGEPFKAAREHNLIAASDVERARIPAGTDLVRTTQLYNRLSGTHVSTRAEWSRSGYGACVIRSGVYRSTAGSQSMLWILFGLHARACLCDNCLMSFMAQWARGWVQGGFEPGAYAVALDRKLFALLDDGVSEETIRAVNRLDEPLTEADRRRPADWARQYSITKQTWQGASARRQRAGRRA